MNTLLIGQGDKADKLLEITSPPFLLIDDGPIADAFISHFRVKEFDLERHSFNPLRGMTYQKARGFVSTLYAAFPEGENTLTVRNGKRALLRLLMDNPQRLDRLHSSRDDATQEALATVNDILLSPLLQKVLCNPTNFSFKGAVVVRLNRAEIGDLDAFLLASLLIGQSKGQIIIPDFGFYGRDFYTPLIRQNRLTAGLFFLDEVSPKLKKTLLMIKDKRGEGCVWEDANTLADYAHLSPGTVAHTEFVNKLIQ